MRMQDITIGQKVWYSTSRDELRKGEGEQVTVVAQGRYTRTWEPCGMLITETKAPGSTMTVIKFAAEDKRSSGRARFGRESSPVQFWLVEGGRYLMHDTEHKVHRDAAADRKLELEAHQARGKYLEEHAKGLVHKALVAAGFPGELITVGLTQQQRWNSKRKKYEWQARFYLDINDEPALALAKSPELTQAVKEHAEWKAQPVPGKDCVV